MSTGTFTLRICRHPNTRDLYALLVDQDGDITDLAGPYGADELEAIRSGDPEWTDEARILDWAARVPWELVEERPLADVREATGALPSAASLEQFAAWATGHAQERVELNIRLYDVWLLLGQVQLSVTHPGISDLLIAELTRLGKSLEALIVATSPAEIAALAAAGWDRSQDQPVVPRAGT